MRSLLLLLVLLQAGTGFAQTLDSLTVARTVDSLVTSAEKLWQAEQYDAALLPAQQAADLARQAWGANNARYANALYRLAITNLSKADYQKAEPLFLEAMNVRERILGIAHPDYARTENALAILYSFTGKYEKAEPLFLDALAIYEKTTGKKQGRYASSLKSLGQMYFTMGNYEKAEKAYLEVAALRAEVLGKDKPDYAASLVDLTRLYLVVGNYKKAEGINAEALAIFERLGQESLNYAYALSDAGTIQKNAGNWEQAEAFLLKSKALREKILGKAHPDYAVSLYNLAHLYLATENYEKAEPALLEAIGVYEKVFGKENTSYLTALTGLASVYRHTGRYEKAESLLLELLDIREKTLGKDNLPYCFNLADLADLYWRWGNSDKTYSYLVNLSEIIRRQLILSSRYLSAEELYAYCNNLFFGGVSADFSFVQSERRLSSTCFDDILFYKGFLLNVTLQVNKLAQTDSAAAQKYELLKSQRRHLAAEYAKPIASRENIAELEAAANALEKDLARSIAGFGEALRQLSWREVQQKLRPGDAAVEFVRFRYVDPESTDSLLYAALVLKPGDSLPQFFPLFEEKELLTQIRGATGGNNFMKINALYSAKAANSKQKSLYALVWQPLQNALQGVTTVYCSPAGLLHRLNLSAIPDAAGKFFGDQRQLVLLGSTRQLVVPTSSMKNTANDAFLAGGIRYDTDSTAIAYANRGASSRSTEPSGAAVFQPDSASITRGGVLDYLPATAIEVREIGQTLATADIQAKVDTGFYATEEAVRQLGIGQPSPRIIHLATHGYFFPDPKDKGQEGGSTFGQGQVFTLSEQPMIRSGLIMAGAKQAWLTGQHPTGQEDGILTAYEISQMDLSGTELVVLSACETGLGDIVGNEGVYGLQRAFKIAGARYLIMSLWKVDDRSTREFMTGFYRHWLTEKQPIPQAFRNTQREMRGKYPGAYDWAGFVLIE